MCGGGGGQVKTPTTLSLSPGVVGRYPGGGMAHLRRTCAHLTPPPPTTGWAYTGERRPPSSLTSHPKHTERHSKSHLNALNGSINPHQGLDGLNRITIVGTYFFPVILGVSLVFPYSFFIFNIIFFFFLNTSSVLP